MVNNKFLESIGMAGIDIGYLFLGMAVFILALLILYIVQIVQTNKLKKRLDKFVVGKDAKSLEKART